MNEWLAGIGLTLGTISPLIVWYSRRNLLGWLSVPSLIVPYLLPLTFLDPFALYPNQISALYVEIVFLGGLSTLIGTFIGYKKVPRIFMPKNPLWTRLDYFEFKKLDKKIYYILLLSIIGIAFSYAVMGFIPAFADNPFEAKFFRGDYQAKYDRIAFLFRTTQQILFVILPMAGVIWLTTRNNKTLFLIVIGIVLTALSLNRGPVGSAVLTILVSWAAFKGRKWWIVAFGFYLAAFTAGSAIWFLIGFTISDDGTSSIEQIVQGSPDLNDQLTFLSAFSEKNDWTFGRTFWGALIPFRYEWNPAVFTLKTVNVTDISEIISGGFRLPPAMWGYVAFGWLGAVLVPFVSSLIIGMTLRVSENSVKYGLVPFMLAYNYMQYVTGIASGFYLLSIYALPPLFVYVYLVSKQSRFTVFRTITGAPLRR